MELAFGDAAFAEEARDDPSGLLHLLGEREPDRDRQAPADDRVAAVEAVRDVEEVHRSAATAAAAFDLAVHLGHDRRALTPRTSAWPWSRYVATTASSGVRADITPTATASSPM